MAVKPRQIVTAHEPIVCDVCRRTLLRGERPIDFLADGRPVQVCELCEPRAVHEGWIRKGDGDQGASGLQRRARPSLLRRLRGEPTPRRTSPPPPSEVLEGRSTQTSSQRPRGRQAEDEQQRHVHGVPTSDVSRIERAVELFNASGLPGRMAGITRSLGAPVVSVRNSQFEGGIVRLTIAWELAWYRFEIDLSDDSPSVRPVARGAELRELDEEELEATNALDDEGKIVDAA